MATLSYTVLLVPDPDRGGFTVTVPEIPEIVTEGDDRDNALAMTREAIALHVGYAAEKGMPLPVEREMPRLEIVDVEVPVVVGGVAVAGSVR